jgi:16S rRNA (cytidine1402-2'-O)-methyltransferase
MVLLFALSAETLAAPAVTIREAVAFLMRTESLSEKEALKRVAKERGIGKSDAYREFQRTPGHPRR